MDHSSIDLRSVVRGGIEGFYSERAAEEPARDPRTYLYASGWHPCRRNLYLQSAQPNDRKPADATTRLRWRRGNDRERSILADLAHYGKHATPSFRPVRQAERVKILGRGGRVLISGVIDATIEIDGFRPSVAFPIEIKSWWWIADRVNTVHDLDSNRWTRGGEMQLLTYLYAKELPVGYLVLDGAEGPNFVRVELMERWDKIARFVDDAEFVVSCLDKKAPPAYLDDFEECVACPFYGRACNPELKAKTQITIEDRREVVEAVEDVFTLRDSRDKFERSHTIVKSAFSGIKSAIAGNFVIKGAPWGSGWRVEIKPIPVREPSGGDSKDEHIASQATTNS